MNHDPGWSSVARNCVLGENAAHDALIREPMSAAYMRAGRGLHLGIGSGFAGFLLTVALLSVSVRIHFALVSLLASVVGALVAACVTWMMDVHRTEALLAKAVDASSLSIDGRYTTPRTWGVYEVARFLNGKRTRFHYIGNHPVSKRGLKALLS